MATSPEGPGAIFSVILAPSPSWLAEKLASESRKTGFYGFLMKIKSNFKFSQKIIHRNMPF